MNTLQIIDVPYTEMNDAIEQDTTIEEISSPESIETVHLGIWDIPKDNVDVAKNTLGIGIAATIGLSALALCGVSPKTVLALL